METQSNHKSRKEILQGIYNLRKNEKAYYTQLNPKEKRFYDELSREDKDWFLEIGTTKVGEELREALDKEDEAIDKLDKTVKDYNRTIKSMPFYGLAKMLVGE